MMPRIATWPTLLISIMCLCAGLCRSQGKLEAKLVLGRTSVRQGEPLYLTYGVVNTTAAPAMASVLTPYLGIEAWTNGAWSGHERELVPEESWPVYCAVPATDEVWAEQKTSVLAAGRYRIRATVRAGGVSLVSEWAILEVVAHEGNAVLIPKGPGAETGPMGMSAEQFTFGSALNMQPKPVRLVERGKHPWGFEVMGQREFEARFQELSQKRGLSDYLRSYLCLMTVVARMGSLYGMTGEERSTHISSLKQELDALGAEIPTERGLGGLRGTWWEARASLAEFVGPEAVMAEREACYKELPKRRTMARWGE